MIRFAHSSKQRGRTDLTFIVLVLLAVGYLVYHHFQFANAVEAVKLRAASPYQESAEQAAIADAAEKATPPAAPLLEGLYTAPIHLPSTGRVGGETQLTIRADHKFVAHLQLLVDGDAAFEGDAAGTWSQKGQALFLDATSGDGRGLLGGRSAISDQRPTGGFTMTSGTDSSLTFRSAAELAADKKAAVALQADMDTVATPLVDIITFGLLRPGSVDRLAWGLPVLLLILLAPVLLMKLRRRDL